MVKNTSQFSPSYLPVQASGAVRQMSDRFQKAAKVKSG